MRPPLRASPEDAVNMKQTIGFGALSRTAAAGAIALGLLTSGLFALPARAKPAQQQAGPRPVFPGVTVSKVAAIGSGFNRMVLNPSDGNIYYMDFSLNIWRLNRSSLNFSSTKVIDFFSPGLPALPNGFYSTGLAFDDRGSIYVLGNADGGPNRLIAVVYRGGPPNASGVRQWNEVVRTEPYAKSNTTYDHVCNGLLADRPNNVLYFTCGSRTDHGEIQDAGGAFPNLREEALTAKMFVVPLNSNGLVLRNDEAWLVQNRYVKARGLRNTYDMALLADGRMIAPDNGPDGDYPDELNVLPAASNPNLDLNYGFPWTMGGLANKQRDPNYNPQTDKLLPPAILAKGFWRNDPTFPAAPANLIEGLVNNGPDADQLRLDDGAIVDASDTNRVLRSWTPHRSMLGISVDTDNSLSGMFATDAFVASYGSVTGQLPDVGRDLLHLEIDDAPCSGCGPRILSARVLATDFYGPVDTVIADGTIYLLDYGSDLGPGAIYQITLPNTPDSSQTTTLRVDIWTDANRNGRRDAGESPAALCGSYTLQVGNRSSPLSGGALSGDCGAPTFNFRSASAALTINYALTTPGQSFAACPPTLGAPNDGVDGDNNASCALGNGNTTLVVSVPAIAARPGQTVQTIDIALPPITGGTGPTPTPIATATPQPPATATPQPGVASIQADVWRDFDQDGRRALTDSGLAGWRFSVFSQNTGALLRTTTSDANGVARVDGLAADAYRLCVESLDGSAPSTPREFDDAGRACYWRSFTAGDFQRMQFGFLPSVGPTPTVAPQPTATPQPGGAAFNALVWDDVNENRSFDTGESALSGIAFTVFDPARGDAVAASGVSAFNGVALLGGLRSGSYRICATLPAGWRATQPPFVDSAGRPCYWYSILSGQVQDVGFGLKRSGAAPTATPTPQPGSGFARFNIRDFNDVNRNGSQDAGEGPPPVAFTYRVLSGDTTIVSATSANGLASLRAAPGSYRICADIVSGYRNTRPNVYDAQGRACYWLTMPADSSVELAFGHASAAVSAAAARDEGEMTPLEPIELVIVRDADTVSVRPQIYLPMLAR
jgi:hypothetical protein